MTDASLKFGPRGYECPRCFKQIKYGEIHICGQSTIDEVDRKLDSVIEKLNNLEDQTRKDRNMRNIAIPLYRREKPKGNDALKACPFCGEEAVLIHTPGYWYAKCDICEASIFPEECRSDAIKKWNERYITNKE